eukprot:scaffold1216_cov357-Prasinococcus_capsulatus_cf.AAC.10
MPTTPTLPGALGRRRGGTHVLGAGVEEGAAARERLIGGGALQALLQLRRRAAHVRHGQRRARGHQRHERHRHHPPRPRGHTPRRRRHPNGDAGGSTPSPGSHTSLRGACAGRTVVVRPGRRGGHAPAAINRPTNQPISPPPTWSGSRSSWILELLEHRGATGSGSAPRAHGAIGPSCPVHRLVPLLHPRDGDEAEPASRPRCASRALVTVARPWPGLAGHRFRPLLAVASCNVPPGGGGVVLSCSCYYSLPGRAPCCRDQLARWRFPPRSCLVSCEPYTARERLLRVMRVVGSTPSAPSLFCLHVRAAPNIGAATSGRSAPSHRGRDSTRRFATRMHMPQPGRRNTYLVAASSASEGCVSPRAVACKLARGRRAEVRVTRPSAACCCLILALVARAVERWLRRVATSSSLSVSSRASPSDPEDRQMTSDSDSTSLTPWALLPLLFCVPSATVGCS